MNINEYIGYLTQFQMGILGAIWTEKFSCFNITHETGYYFDKMSKVF